ncbi:MAG: hypothetical protein WDA04_04855 [Anaerolineaceae bacterium]
MNEQNAWPEITSTLNALNDETLSDLLASSQQLYDGNYVILAEPTVYSNLCQYYPLIETVVQDHSGRHFRLNLQSSVPMGTDNEAIQIYTGAANITDAIIRPETIIAVPSYLLRFVPHVGSAPVLIATALRQAFYFSSREDGASQLYPKSGNDVTIDVQSILRMLGNSISRAKFFRIFKNGQMDWFVQRADPVHQFVDGQIRRLPNTYIYRGQLLTPGDAADLAAWLLGQDLTAEPAAVLTRALHSPRNQILTFPFRMPDSPKDAGLPSLSVHQVVSQLLNTPRLDPTLSGLCDRLSSHLIRPESFLALPWYWFTNVLPELGDDLGMLYLMAKNCCYIDWARGQDRNHFWVVGGIETLQGWIGSATLPKRIPHASKSKRGRPRNEQIQPESQYTRDWRAVNRELASQYLLRSATRKTKDGTDWQLRVSEVQLTAQDETLRQAVSAFLHFLPAPLTDETLTVFASEPAIQALMLAQSKSHTARLCHFETLANQGICHFETLSPQEICHFDTLVDALNSYFETLIAAGICQFDTIINILINIKHTLIYNQNSAQPHTLGPQKVSTALEKVSAKKVEGRESGDFKARIADREVETSGQEDKSLNDLERQNATGPAVEHVSDRTIRDGFGQGNHGKQESNHEDVPEPDWDYEKLLSTANPALKKRILDANLQRILLSWLIEASLSPGVHSPLSLAISRTLQTRKPASLTAQHLAQLSYSTLSELLSSVCQRLTSGQTGSFAYVGEGSSGLVLLLQGVDDRATQLRLLHRLASSLYIE